MMMTMTIILMMTITAITTMMMMSMKKTMLLMTTIMILVMTTKMTVILTIFVFFFFFRLKLNLDFWSHPSHVGASVDIRVSMEAYPALAKLLKENGIVFTILIPDVQTLMDSENPPLARSERAGFSYNRYNRLQPVKE